MSIGRPPAHLGMRFALQCDKLVQPNKTEMLLLNYINFLTSTLASTYLV